MAAPEWNGENSSSQGASIFLCDLAPKLTEYDLRQVFCFYGDIVSLQYVDQADGGCAVITYGSPEAAAEAKEFLHLALLRGKTCRCIMSNGLEAIWKTMESGERLVLEGLDPLLESRGLQDVCTLFGTVLDCKVQPDEQGQSKGYGFAHFEQKEDAEKAMSVLNQMQIGSSVVEVRPYEAARDAERFTACKYSAIAPSYSGQGENWGPGLQMNFGGYEGWDEDGEE
eukprot:TRINITY_DN95211_c0_g1_i1.p1 TRINITY_DN95211_c0_g1~~TRINITY_DN95211_c0_g1_i1.p1  ORF type:complete len:226 (-),score=57.77 TRINITY_DN95211_c0_g1_i1:91-768(-)